jgi:hypothetical protein
LDERLTGRTLDADGTRNLGEDGDEPAEWISAGYHGEGMVYAWLCGVAVGRMVVGSQDEDIEKSPGMPAGKVASWLPKELLVSYKRVQAGDIIDIVNER